MIRRLIATSFLAAMLVLGAACSNITHKDAYNNARGRGDSPVGAVDNTAKEVIQFPDRFGNIATACDHHGHRIFVTTNTDSGKFLAVINDPNC